MGKSEMICDCDIIHQDAVNDVREKMLDESILLDMADFYKALSDSTRIKIIDVIREGELCVCDISVLLNMTKSSVSHQLKNLREMNLIKCRRQGKEIYYSLADEHVLEVFDICKIHVMERNNEEKD